MARMFRRIHASLLAPTGKSITLGIRLNQLIWTKYFDTAWDSIPLHEKLTWIVFVSHTLAVITLLHLLAL